MYIYQNLNVNTKRCFIVRFLHLLCVLILLNINQKFNKSLVLAIVIGLLHTVYIIVDVLILWSMIYYDHMYKFIYMLDIIFIFFYSEIEGTFFRYYFMILPIFGFCCLIIETYEITKNRKYKAEIQRLAEGLGILK